MKLSEEQACLAFHLCPGIGPQKFSTILSVFGSAANAWESSHKEWKDKGFTDKFVEAFFASRQAVDLEKTLADMARLGIHYLARTDDAFPPLLKQIPDCPTGLFIKGKLLPSDSKALAVVGTRKITPYGREVTETFVRALVYAGFTVVSGLARGVDGVAHRVALGNGGRTLAVLGHGLDMVYPPEHKGLAREIVDHGALISEFPIGILPAPGNFPARNRIVSGLSLGVLVTEGASKSGSKITALTAVEQNRDVFAVPGPITSLQSQGPAELIQMGAKLVMSAKDIVNELKVGDGNDANMDKVFSVRTMQPHFSDANQEVIWQYLINGTQHIDEIIRNTKLTAPVVTTTLTLMEINGLVKHIGDGNYMVV